VGAGKGSRPHTKIKAVWYETIETLTCSSFLMLHSKADTLSKELAGGCP